MRQVKKLVFTKIDTNGNRMVVHFRDFDLNAVQEFCNHITIFEECDYCRICGCALHLSFTDRVNDPVDFFMDCYRWYRQSWKIN